MADLCKHCGKVESEHHAFEARLSPTGECVCDCFAATPENAKPACRRFEPYEPYNWCWNCGHDRACHAPKD